MRYFTFENILIAFTQKEDKNQRNPDNINKIKEKLYIKNIYIPNQKHTNIVLNVEDYKNQECDGLYTDKKEVALGVLTADCIPVVLFNGKEIAVIHAGWRGLFGGIIENGVKMFKNKSIKAFIGPSIRGCCYEVDKQFVNDLNINKKFYKIYHTKAYLDLVAVAKDKLKNLSVKEVFDTDECTKCSEKYFSYRNGDFESRILTLGVIRWD
jgi:YfiH family protein